MIQKNTEISLLVHFLAPFLLLALVSAETMESDQVGSQTGNRLAVLEFGSKGISAPMKILLTEQFRETLKKLNMYEVLDKGFTDRVEIFYPGETVYGECATLRCITELGKMLGVNYLVWGTINEKNDEYFIEGRLFSIDLEMEVKGFSLQNMAAVDSVKLEMKKLAYDISGLDIPDTLSIGSVSTISSVDSLEGKKNSRIWALLPRIPGKVRSLIYSTAIPGTGQIYSKRNYTGFGIIGTEMILGGLALLAHSNYKRSWGGFESTYNSYQSETDPATLLEMRPDIINYANDTQKYNNFMKGVRNIGLAVWGMNMVHAYIVGPEDIFVETDDLSIDEYGQLQGASRMKVWDLMSGFGVRGIILRPIFKGSSLSAYDPYMDGGLLLHTPLGLHLGPVFTSLSFEMTKYSFHSPDFNNTVTGTSFSTALNLDLSRLVRFGGNQLRKYIFLGRSSYTDGKGFMIGGDIAFQFGSSPLFMALMGRANIVSLLSTGTSAWVTIGANIGLDIP